MRLNILIFLFAYASIGSTDYVSSKIILEKMMEQIQSIKTLRYHVHSKERIDGKYLEVYAEAKLNVEPLKLYVKNPEKKLELLYVAGTNDEDAFVSPGKFPFITLSLNPYNNIMRKDQHHTIKELGFNYMGVMLSKTFPTDAKQFEKLFINAGTVTWKGHTCYKIFSDNADFKYVPYKVRKGDTVKSISYKFNCGEYRILEKNPTVPMNKIIDEGKIITVPNSYASKILLFVDVVSYLPVGIFIYDNEGLYESYEFSNVDVNTVIKPEEFQRNYKGYNF